MTKLLKKMEKKTNKKDSNNHSLNGGIEKSISHAKKLLIKEKEYEEYLKHIEKLSRGVYDI